MPGQRLCPGMESSGTKSRVTTTNVSGGISAEEDPDPSPQSAGAEPQPPMARKCPPGGRGGPPQKWSPKNSRVNRVKKKNIEDYCVFLSINLGVNEIGPEIIKNHQNVLILRVKSDIHVWYCGGYGRNR